MGIKPFFIKSITEKNLIAFILILYVQLYVNNLHVRYMYMKLFHCTSIVLILIMYSKA